MLITKATKERYLINGLKNEWKIVQNVQLNISNRKPDEKKIDNKKC